MKLTPLGETVAAYATVLLLVVGLFLLLWAIGDTPGVTVP